MSELARTNGPGGVSNPPGRPALSYRITTHDDVLERCLSALSDRLPLLTTHGTDDPAVALLDAWATVADIVTFYQERIANEGFVRTATERGSVLELARAIGYELRPGAAASTYLSFTVEDASGAPGRAVVPAGTAVQSVPGQGELPQTFETGQELVALAERNAIPLRPRRPQRVGGGTTGLHLAGTTTGLRPGDVLLIRSGAEPRPWQVRTLRTVEPLPTDPTGRPASTVVRWDEGLDLPAATSDQPVEVYAFRLRAALFGHNAPDWRTMPVVVQERYTAAAGRQGTARFDEARFDQTRFDVGEQWPGFALTDPPEGADGPVIDLGAGYPALLPGSWLVLRAPGVPDQLYQVTAADLSAAADFSLTATTTRLRLRGKGKVSPFDRRATAVHTQSERLELADEPVTGLVAGPLLLLDRPVALDRGAPVVVTGTTADGVTVAEQAFVGSVAADSGQVTLDRTLERPLDPASVRLLGNVVAATAGQSTEEVLGSGDGRAANQRFTLLHKDLTHVSAPTVSGVRDTLVVRVDGVAWTETASLFSLGPHDRSYVVRIQDDATAAVVFGDGERGARLPSGQENLSAAYRTGIGPGGNVRPDSLTLLQKRPLGIRGVGNPLAATGGAAPEQSSDARTDAPLTVRALDRVVSLDDHEDFARTFAGIAKARAIALRGAPAAFVHITVAAPGGAPVSPGTLSLLRAALDAAGLPGRKLGLDSYQALPFTVGVTVLAAPDRKPDEVYSTVVNALREVYAFDRREFAQPVTAAEALATVQRVPGVVAANLTALHLSGEPAGVADFLPAHEARLCAGGVARAQLLVLTDLTVEGMTS